MSKLNSEEMTVCEMVPRHVTYRLVLLTDRDYATSQRLCQALDARGRIAFVYVIPDESFFPQELRVPVRCHQVEKNREVVGIAGQAEGLPGKHGGCHHGEKSH
jgi:hypothetical protein